MRQWRPRPRHRGHRSPRPRSPSRPLPRKPRPWPCSRARRDASTRACRAASRVEWREVSGAACRGVSWAGCWEASRAQPRRRPATTRFQALQWRREPFETEAYDRIHDNPFLAARTNPLSTFSVDVDTASYANVRRFLSDGRLPPRDAVRIEELLNYFRYDYPQPTGSEPFSITTEVAACPWKPAHRLVLVGLQGREVAPAQVPPRNLVFLLDVSGSMNEPRKLPLAEGIPGPAGRPASARGSRGDRGLCGSRRPRPALHRRRPQEARSTPAVERLEAGGSTARRRRDPARLCGGGGGLPEGRRQPRDPGHGRRLQRGRDAARATCSASSRRSARPASSSRSSASARATSRTPPWRSWPTTATATTRTSTPCGRAARCWSKEAGATLVTIAKDVKIQVEFNPARVSAYRLIGYENRAAARGRLRRRPQGCGRDRGRPLRDRALRGRAGGRRGSTCRPWIRLKYQAGAAPRGDRLRRAPDREAPLQGARRPTRAGP